MNKINLKVVMNLIMSNLFRCFKGCLCEHRNFWLHSQDVLACRMVRLNGFQQKLLRFQCEGQYFLF